MGKLVSLRPIASLVVGVTLGVALGMLLQARLDAPLAAPAAATTIAAASSAVAAPSAVPASAPAASLNPAVESPSSISSPAAAGIPADTGPQAASAASANMSAPASAPPATPGPSATSATSTTGDERPLDPPTAPAIAPSISAPPPAAVEPPPSIPAERTERYWTERAAVARDRLISAYETCLAQGKAPYKYIVSAGHTVEIIDPATFAESKAAFESAKANFRFLRDEARRAGAPPGWVRVDWSVYARGVDLEAASCERTPPNDVVRQ